MAVLTVTNLTKSFGSVDIFNGISFSISNKAKVGLVGPNGVGKTTLLRIIVGEEPASDGAVSLTKGMRVGYLPQQAKFLSERTLKEECMSVFSGMIAKQNQLHELEKQMGIDSSDMIGLVETYGSLQAEFELAGGYQYEVRIQQTLAGLGFSAEDGERPLQQLSGGQRTRAFLAKLLLEEPDLLLLDEPTNHLDIGAVEWLEAYLKDWRGAVLIVSHDRYFLDQVAESIWEMTPDLETYKGNYSTYLQQRGERYARKLAEYEAQKTFIEKEEEYIRRNIAGQNTRQAKGRRTRLERMLDEAKITPPPAERRLMRLSLNALNRSGNQVLRTYGLQVGYEDEGSPLFSTPDLILNRKECAAIIGPNGAGKTTFLKTILAQIPPFEGQVELGAGLRIGYFAQAHEDLSPERTLMQEIEIVNPQLRPAEIRDYLAKFLFRGEDVFKTVKLLSGGERGRLALAILGLRGANLLLLDEPTNHLDLPSQEILQSMLSEFDGTILLVSHDRFLIDALASQIWEVDPKNNCLIVFEGSYSEYKDFQFKDTQKKNIEPVNLISDKTTAPLKLPEKKAGLSKNERKRLEQKLKLAEAEISELEALQARLEMELQNPPSDSTAVIKLSEEYDRTHKMLQIQLQNWEEIASQLEEEQ
ncbi:MAG: ABC-F family ATP-binding cassette domain-containing protein [Anaerolineaceae bacterium]